MASFRLRGNRWQARVRRQGHPDETRSFLTRQDAERWARSVETGMDRGSFVSQSEAQKVTLGDLILRYIDEVLPEGPNKRLHAFRLKAMARRKVSRVSMAALTPTLLAKYREERLAEVSAGTVIREFACLSSIINHARREWGIRVVNPVPLVRKPKAPKGRDRLLSPDELSRLLAALEPDGRRSVWMKPLVQFALETAMRRGELLALRWSDLDLDARTATLHETKNGEKRVVPLSSTALGLLRALPRSLTGKVFPMNGPAVSKAWDTAVRRASLKDLHFHDLRHMAVTRMADRLPNLVELAAVSGHRSLAMLRRYYHPNPRDLALKLG